MGLESVNHISDLVAANPLGTDPRSEGDNHIRNVKTALKTDFPNISGAMTSNQSELNVLDGVTAGTVTASLGVVVDSSSKVDVWNVDNLTLNGNSLTSTSGDLQLAAVSGSSVTLQDDADNTKEVTLDMATVSTGTERTWIFPDASDTFVGIAGTQSLSGKTLVSPTITTSPTAAGATWTDLGAVTTTDINGGTIDGTNIGASSVGTGAFSTLGATGTVTGPSGTWDAGGIDIATTDTYAIAGTDVLNATTLGTAVVASSLTSVGTLTSLTVDNLNLNGNTIISTDTAGDINITPDTTGDIVLDGVKWPQADGSSNQILVTNGSGQSSWATSASTTVLTTQGDMLFRDSSGLQRLGTGTSGQFLTSGGAAADLSWSTGAAGDVTASSTDTFTNKTIDANGTGNSITNIDVADLANGTDGEIITWDSNGAPTTVAVGTSTHVLTSNGTGAAPTFQAASSGGKVLQQVHSGDGAVATGTTTMPSDDTIPQNTEGDEYMTLAITPSNSSNRLLIIANCFLTNTTSVTQSLALFQDSTAGALASMALWDGQTTAPQSITLIYEMAAGTTSSTTFKLRSGGQTAGTTSFNGTSGSRLHGGVLSSTLTITELSS